MRATTIICLLLLLGCSKREQQLSPRHVEVPSYPQLARFARAQGKVVLLVTIDSRGSVIDAKAINDDKSGVLLKNDAVDNIRHWTFANPNSARRTQSITFDYEIDESRPRTPIQITTVSFDLPDRVTITTNVPDVNP